MAAFPHLGMPYLRMSSSHSLCFLTRALIPETSASDVGRGLIVHCPIVFRNIENDRKVRYFIIPNPEALEKQSPDVCWNTLAVHLLAEEARHSERCRGHFYTEKVKETLLNKGEGFEELPESVLNLSPLDLAWNSQITVLMGNGIFLSIVRICTLVTNRFMHELVFCNVLYPLELTAVNTGNLKLMIAYDVTYVRQG